MRRPSVGGETEASTPRTEALDTSAGQALVRQFVVEVVSGPDAGVLHRSTGVRLVVGTHDSADLVLHDSAVSRFHFEIRIAGGRALLRDLGSLNGTLVSGVPVEQCE